MTGRDPDAVARFLMRSLFAMFAEDVGLLPERGFTDLLEGYRDDLEMLPDALTHLSQTMTGLYNVLEKERAGEALDEDERRVHEQGLVGVLRELHDELDAAVAAYGWPADLDDEQVLYRLVALNKERRAEEEQGRVRYLHPAY